MADKLFYSMGEVAEMFDVNTSLIRHWEAQFSILRPKRNKKGILLPEQLHGTCLPVDHVYPLVNERGITLEGAKKALRKAPSESGVDRDAELMERLQRIRALLVEVREDLKAGEGEIVTASDADMTDVDASAAAAADTAAAAETPVRRRRAKAVVKIDEPSDDAAGKAAGKAAGDSSAQPAVKRSVRRPRRKKEEAETKELFAFYEQSLF